jgi:AcrR family transcriptional regulator
MPDTPARARASRGSLASRIVQAAGQLFDANGVDGTSLQMIADQAGIAKAAVYYHFKTKEEIVGAVHAQVFAEFYAAVDDAEATEAAYSRADALKALIPRLVKLAVRGRRAFSRILTDPAIVRLTADDDQLKLLRSRFDRLVTGGERDPEGLVRGAVVVGAITSAALQSPVSQLDYETLQFHLSRILWDVVAPTLADRTPDAALPAAAMSPGNAPRLP